MTDIEKAKFTAAGVPLNHYRLMPVGFRLE